MSFAREQVKNRIVDARLVLGEEGREFKFLSPPLDMMSVWMERQMALKQSVKKSGVLDPETVACRDAFLASSLTVLESHAWGQEDMGHAGMIERAVWKYGFYAPIHEYRVRCGTVRRGSVVDGFEGYIEQSIAWYTHLLQRLDVIKESVSEAGGIEVTMSRCSVCIGDLYRYKIQHITVSRGDVSASKDAYVNAIRLWPVMGNPYNQLAVLFHVAEDPFRSLFYYIRSATAREPFPSADQNMSMFLHNALQVNTLPVQVKREGKSSLHEVQGTLGNTCLRIVAMLYLQVDIDAVLEVWKGGLSSMEEYLNRRLQKIRKSVGNTRPVFGKSRMLGDYHSAPGDIQQHSKEFRDPSNLLTMMVHSMVLLMQGKLEHAKCDDSIRSTLARAYGYAIVLDMTGRVASLVGRCRPLLKQTHNSKCIDLVVSDMLVPLLMLLSWIAKDWHIHKDSSLKSLFRLSDTSFVDRALKKFLRGVLSMAHAMSHFADNVARDNGKLSRLSHMGMIRGCPLLETIMDYPLLVVKSKWEEEYGVPFSSRKHRKKAHGLQLSTWTAIHTAWTMVVDVAHHLHEGPVTTCLGDRYDVLRAKIHQVAIERKTQSVSGDAVNSTEHEEPRRQDVDEEEEIIVYTARKSKRTVPQGVENLVDDAFMPHADYNTFSLAAEMAEEVLADEDHVGPSNEYMCCNTPGSEFGNILQYQ